MKLHIFALIAFLALAGPSLAWMGPCLECGHNGVGCAAASKADSPTLLDTKNGNGPFSLAYMIKDHPLYRVYVDGNTFTMYGAARPDGAKVWPINERRQFLYVVKVGDVRKIFYLNGFDVCGFTLPGLRPTPDNTMVAVWHISGT